MALNLSALTAQEQAAAIYIGYFDRAPDPYGMDFWEAAVANPVVPLVDIATYFAAQEETLGVHPFFVEPSEAAANAFISELYLNLFNRAPDVAGLEFWGSVLSGSIAGTNAFSVGEIILEIIQGAQNTAAGQDITTLLNKIEVANAWTAAAKEAGLTEPNSYGDSEIAQNSAKSITDGVTDDVATVAAAKAAVTSFFTEGQTFTLTTGVDRGADFTGTAGDDTFIAYPAGADSDVETLTSLDVIDGGDGTDTLDIAALGEFTAPTSATVQNIEIANVVGDDDITVDASEWTGLQTLNATGSVDATLTAAATTDVNVANATGAVDVTGGADVAVTDSTGAITVDDAAGAVSVSDAADTVTIDGGTDVTVSGVAGMDAAIGGTTAATGNITLTHAAQGTDAIEIDGGVDVTVTAEGVTSGTIGVGSNTSPTGAITVAQTGADYTAATANQLGAITIVGGTTVNVTQVASSDTTDAEEDVSAETTTFGAVMVTGGETTTSVTVTQDARNTAVDYVAATDDTAATVGEMGVANGNVDIYDANATDDTEAGTITTVTLNNFAAATVDSSALTTVNLSGTGDTLGVSRGALDATPTANTLTINVDGFTSTGAITDAEAGTDDGFTTINLNATGDATTIDELDAADLTTLNITGDAAVELTTLTAAALTSVTAGDGGVTIGSELETATAFTSGAGDDSIIVGATTEAIATGAGDDTVELVSGTTALGTDGTIDAGDGVDTLSMTAADAATASASTTFEGSISNFEKLELGAATTNTVNLANLDDINDVTVARVASGGTLTLSGASTGVDVRFADDTQTATTVTLAEDGDADVANIHVTNAGTDNTATLGTVTLTGFETVNFNTADTDTDETDAVIEVTALTAADATAITVTGDAGLDLGFTGIELTSFDASGVTAGGVTYTTGALDNAATLTGGAGADTFDASSATASVTLSGNAGDDTLTGSAQADEINGGEGDDLIAGAAGNDTVDGGAGDDVITGGAGNDVIDGGEGDDVITGGAGGDTITTGAGADTVVFTAVADSTGATLDTVIDFETGVDKLQFALSGATVDVSGFATTANFTDGVIGLNSAAGDLFYSTADGKLFVEANGDGQINSGNDYVVSVDAIAAADINFDITGDGTTNTLTGGAGDDTFDVTAGTGTDTITSGGGDDVVVGYDADVIVFSGTETIAAAASGSYTNADDVVLSYTSDAATGFITFVEADVDDPVWTLEDKIAVVSADETLNVADKVSMFTDASDTYVYYSGATTAASDNQLMKLEGFTGANKIDVTTPATGLTVVSAPSAADITFTSLSTAYTGTGSGYDNTFNVHAWEGMGVIATHASMGAGHTLISFAGKNAINVTAAGSDTVLSGYLTANPGARAFLSTYDDSAPYHLDASSETGDMVLAAAIEYGGYGITAYEMTGGSGDDMLFGTGVGDILTGGAGADFILGGNGADSLTGDAGADVLMGGAGNDTLIADDTDTIDGGDDTDTAAFAAAVSANNLLDADLVNVENVTVAGAFTFDFSVQTEALDITAIASDTAANTILGGTGNDTIDGGAGDDELTGGAGADELTGGLGNDQFNVDAGADDITDFGDGADKVDITAGATLAADVTADYTAAAAGDIDNGAAAADAVFTVANDVDFDASAATDTTNGITITAAGNAAASTLVGTDQADVITGGDGADTIDGGDGDDTIDGGDGDDVITGGAGADQLTGGDGADMFVLTDRTAIDTITDFVSADDTISLNGGTQAVTSSQLSGISASTTLVFDTASVLGNLGMSIANDSVGNNGAGVNYAVASDTGAIFYDADGDWNSGSVQIGTVGSASLVDSDFII